MLLLKNVFVKRRRKLEKGAFHPNSNKGDLCPVPLLTSAAAFFQNISSSCKVNAAIMSTFLHLLHLCLQKFYYK